MSGPSLPASLPLSLEVVVFDAPPPVGTAAENHRLRDPLFARSAPTAWPRGKECIIDYDGYVLNDIRRMDKIVIESIGGLPGPDLNAEAEKNSDRDGETPYDLTYGGRTITLRGYVEAGNLDTMRALFSYVLDAFDGGVNPSTERQLWFRWMDWRDYFVDSNALIDYRFDDGDGTLGIASNGSGLAPVDTTTKELILYPATATGIAPTRHTYGDGEAIIAFRVATSLAAASVGAMFRRVASTTKLVCRYEGSDSSLHLLKVVAGAETELGSILIDPGLALNTSYYMRVRAEGDVISYSIWAETPPDVGGTPLADSTHTLSTGNSSLFPASTEGLLWGLYWTPSGTSDRIEMLDIGAINKGDAVTWCRKTVQTEGDETQDNEFYRRPFAAALRCSDARFVSRKPTIISTIPRNFALTFPADGSGLIFPADGSGLVFGGSLDAEPVNLGRSPASPIIRLYGPMTNPILRNSADGRQIGIAGSVETGDYYEFDTARHTVVDSGGSSVYRNIDENTNWLSLAPGTNSILLGADSITSGTSTDLATVNAASNTFTKTAHGLIAGQVIAIQPISGSTPFVLNEESIVYVRDVTTNTFKVAETLAGSVVDIMSDGSVKYFVDLGYVEFIYRHSAR